jgi:SAM-dependent methyltransferase
MWHMGAETRPRERDPADQLQLIRRSRRRPSITQFDYLHLRYLVRDLRQTLGEIPGPVHDVLDVWCGSRPYEDLLPSSAHCVGLDVEGNPYGVADVVSNEVLPFPDGSFDLVLCIEAFQWIPDAPHAVAEFRRVLRPGGVALVTMPFAFEYDRKVPESRYTEHELRALFAGWDEVEVRENGGRTATWTVLTASMLAGVEQRLARGALRPLRPLFTLFYVSLNAIGLFSGALESRYSGGHATLPMNLMLTAHRPGHD